MINDSLFVIPARGGSKGVPGKNIKPLLGKPLIYYSIDEALKLSEKENLCVSTDDPDIKKCVENYGVEVPFIRPVELSSDNAGMYEVLLHAIDFFEADNKFYKKLILLQPTSPFRKAYQIFEAYKLFNVELEMVVSVKEASANPYFTLVEEDDYGYLKKCKESDFVRRQDCPKVYEYNGAIYIMDIQALKERPISKFSRVKKYVMDEISSVDIDTNLDWLWAEFLGEKGQYK